MAKGKATSNCKHTKAPPKKAAPLKNAAPKKAPAPQLNSNNKGSWKRAAEDLDDTSLGESSGEEPDYRPQKNHCGKENEVSNEDVDDMEIVVDSEVQIFKRL